MMVSARKLVWPRSMVLLLRMVIRFRVRIRLLFLRSGMVIIMRTSRLLFSVLRRMIFLFLLILRSMRLMFVKLSRVLKRLFVIR